MGPERRSPVALQYESRMFVSGSNADEMFAGKYVRDIRARVRVLPD